MASSSNNVGEISTQPINEPPNDEVTKLKTSLQREKAAKRKMYSYLVKIADELKTLRNESEQLIQASEFARKAWYEGGMWRGPNVLPGAANIMIVNSNHGGTSSTSPAAGNTDNSSTAGQDGNNNNNEGTPMGGGPMLVPRAPVSLSDLFLDIVTVTAFSRVGAAIQDRGTIDLPIIAYFALFWSMWNKEASYSTRFDTTDISSHLETLLACFALLGGSLSAYSDFHSDGCTRIMGMGMFVSFLHALLHARVWYWFTAVTSEEEEDDQEYNSLNNNVKRYAIFNTVMNCLEMINWFVGMFVLTNDSSWRGWIFLLGIILNMRLPHAFMPNDFHAACSKRGVLFILLLGFNLQSIVSVASPYFNYWDPSWDQYAFLFLACFLLFMIKLLYVDDTYSISPQDHALLYNRAAGFFFHLGNFALLLFTTVLGSGLNLLTHSFLAAAQALPNDAKNLVCGGFSATVFSIAFIKSMHIRRIPTNPKHERQFLIAYCTQIVGALGVVFITARMCLLPKEADYGFLALLMQNEIEMLAVLVLLALLLIIMSWLDEAVELRLYSDASEASEFRVHPFGFWACFKHEDNLQLEALALERNRSLSSNHLLGSSVMSFSGIQSGGSMYNSFAMSNPNLSKADLNLKV